MKEFLAAQERREENLLAEIQELKTSLPRTERVQSPVQPNVTLAPGLRGLGPQSTLATPSTVTATSPRFDLPTPAPTQRVHQDAPIHLSGLRIFNFGGKPEEFPMPFGTDSDWHPKLQEIGPLHSASIFPSARPNLAGAGGSMRAGGRETRHRGRKFPGFTPRQRRQGEHGPGWSVSSEPATGTNQDATGCNSAEAEEVVRAKKMAVTPWKVVSSCAGPGLHTLLSSCCTSPVLYSPVANTMEGRQFLCRSRTSYTPLLLLHFPVLYSPVANDMSRPKPNL
ncbi:hypothetical protein INR49_031096 [Caranx melampygus]|nr:hypothetical protein INR49_031096 [Caranx melampygus]